MYKRIKQFTNENKMLEGINCVVVGLSGGADSVCLLLMLKELVDENVKIIAVHVHHNIRGTEADLDASFSKELSAKLGVEYREFRYDIPGMALREHMSEEEMGRKMRYEAFLSVADEYKNSIVAVAHHKNDQAETILFNLVRGSYLKGVRGMEAKSDRIIRPLLCVTGDEIREYLDNNGIRYCIDSTNAECDYSRNIIRNRVMPSLISDVNTETVNNICRFGSNMGEIEDYIDMVSDKAYRKLYNQGVISNELMNEHNVIKKNVAYRVLRELYGARDLEQKHVDYLLTLFEMQCGRKINLPGDIIAVRTYDGVSIKRSNEDVCEADLLEYSIEIKPIMEVGDRKISDVISKKNDDDHYTKYFDYDKIKNYITENGIQGSIVVRHRQSGDYILIDEQAHKKTVKALLVDKKIPGEDRGNIWLFAIENLVLYIPGVRNSEAFRVTDKTETILIISIKNSP